MCALIKVSYYSVVIQVLSKGCQWSAAMAALTQNVAQFNIFRHKNCLFFNIISQKKGFSYLDYAKLGYPIVFFTCINVITI